MAKIIHPFAAVIATLCIATFFISTIIVEFSGSPESIVFVKSLIVMPGLLILVPSIAITGITGFVISKNRKGRLLENKKKRMPFIGANGVLILLPAALFLDQWASAGSYDTKFYILQALELLAGAVNLSLLSFNIRDGLRLSTKRRP